MRVRRTSSNASRHGIATAAGTAAAASVIALSVAGLAAPAWAGSQAPSGNNGTIKIESGPPDDDKANEPHVSCEAYVEFWGYDQGTQTASLSFDAQAPTDGGTVLEATTSWTTARREGGRHLDHTYGPVPIAAAFQRAGIAPAAQGYHVKLTVHVTGSQGADTKHKVFWVEPCATTTTTTGGSTATTVPATTSTTAGVGSGGTTASTIPGTSTTVSGASTTVPDVTTTIGDTVLGVTFERPSGLAAAGSDRSTTEVLAADGSTASVLGTEQARGGGSVLSRAAALPRTGLAVGGLASVAGALLGGGTALRSLGARRRAVEAAETAEAADLEA